MVRIFKSFALLLLLLAAQQGSVVHELGHLVAAGSHGISVESGSGDAAPCALCPAFAQASAPAFSYSFQFPFLDRAATQRETAAPLALVDVPAPIPRSRGPPV